VALHLTNGAAWVGVLCKKQRALVAWNHGSRLASGPVDVQLMLRKGTSSTPKSAAVCHTPMDGQRKGIPVSCSQRSTEVLLWDLLEGLLHGADGAPRG